MKNVLMIVAPGYRKKTGYYLRANRDKNMIEKIGFSVMIWDFLKHIRRYGLVHATLFFSKKISSFDYVVCENISAVLPILIFNTLSKIKRNQKLIFVSHGSLEDLRPYPFFYFKYPFYKYLEYYALKKFDYVFCVSQVMKETFIKKIVNESKFLVTPNVPDKSFIEQVFAEKEINKTQLRKSLRLPVDKKIICYCGNLQAWQKIDLLIEVCVRLAKNNSYYFVFLTKEVEGFAHKLKSMNLNDDLFLLKSVSNDDVPQYLVASDLLYAVRDENETNRVACPTKLVEYIYSGTDIIVSKGIGDISTIIKNYSLGIVVSEAEVMQPQRLADKIVSYFYKNKFNNEFEVKKSIFSVESVESNFREAFNGKTNSD